MDIIFLIRSLIFLTAGLVLLIFPKQILEWQIRWNVRICKWLFHKNYDVSKGRKSGKKANQILAYVFFIVAVLLFWVAVR